MNDLDFIAAEHVGYNAAPLLNALPGLFQAAATGTQAPSSKKPAAPAAPSTPATAKPDTPSKAEAPAEKQRGGDAEPGTSTGATVLKVGAGVGALALLVHFIRSRSRGRR